MRQTRNLKPERHNAPLAELMESEELIRCIEPLKAGVFCASQSQHLRDIHWNRDGTTQVQGALFHCSPEGSVHAQNEAEGLCCGGVVTSRIQWDTALIEDD